MLGGRDEERRMGAARRENRRLLGREVFAAFGSLLLLALGSLMIAAPAARASAPFVLAMTPSVNFGEVVSGSTPITLPIEIYNESSTAVQFDTVTSGTTALMT